MDLKAKLSNARHKLPPLLRRTSKDSTTTLGTSHRTLHSSASSDKRRSSLRKSTSMTKLPAVSSESVAVSPADADELRLSKSEVLPRKSPAERSSASIKGAPAVNGSDSRAEGSSCGEAPLLASASGSPANTSTVSDATTASALSQQQNVPVSTARPTVTVEEPTPIKLPVDAAGLAQKASPPPDAARLSSPITDSQSQSQNQPSSRTAPSKNAPPTLPRRQSLVAGPDARVIKTLLGPDKQHHLASGPATTSDYFGGGVPFTSGMLHRKIWVKRPNASATLVQIREDDLVDDVRDMILRKYANSLGKAFDSPDITLRIHPRDDGDHKAHDRILGPEEEMCRTLDAYFPGGQTVADALLIDVPHRKTPKPSPRVPVYYAHHDDTRPYESASEYFPQMPLVQQSPAAMTVASHDTRGSMPHAHSHGSHSIAVLQTGQLPPLPSPGGTRRNPHPHSRPKYPRHNTASPTALAGGVPLPAGATRPPQQRQRQDSSASDAKHSTSSGNHPIPTPPAPTDSIRHESNPPTPRVASPRPVQKRKKQKNGADVPSLPSGLLDNSVPPINVLIVEDNIINLRVLGAFMQRLKVRWQRAMNGKEAVTKWRAGGFHLVLMDIQLPIMNGLEATKEIRRLERVNSIGVFSSGSSEAPNNRLDGKGQRASELQEDDKLGDKSLFKSPVIIVALTASSLQSDRHEALAAGCNDFLTKPVNFVWLERKVKEWGCMQALIDFDGWRKWKDFAAAQSDNANQERASTSYSTYASRPQPVLNAISPASSVPSTTTINGTVPAPATTAEQAAQKKSNRRSMGIQRPPSLPEEESTSPVDIDGDVGMEPTP